MPPVIAEINKLEKTSSYLNCLYRKCGNSSLYIPINSTFKFMLSAEFGAHSLLKK